MPKTTVTAIPANPPAQAQVTRVAPAGLTAQVTCVPTLEAKIKHMGPPPKAGFTMGTLGGESYHNLTERLKPTHPDRIAAEAAFNQLKGLARSVPEYRELESLFIDIDNCMARLTMKDGTTIHVTIGEFKQKIVAAQPAGGGDVNGIVVDCFQRFELAFLRIGVTTISHYSPDGADELASPAGRQALQVGPSSPVLVQHKQAFDLVTDTKKGKYGILQFIEHTAPDGKRKKEAVDQTLRAEAFRILFRDRLKERIDALSQTLFAETDPVAKEAMEKTLHRYTQLHNQVLHLNRRALWASAIYNDPNECFRRILYDHYLDCYAEEKNPHKIPSFRRFCEMPESEDYQKEAAEVASLLIADPREYRLFCHNHKIEPRNHHINRLFNEALRKDPASLDLAHLGHPLPPVEQAEIVQLIVGAKKESDELAARVDALVPPSADAKTRLKTALAAQSLGPLLQDQMRERGFWEKVFSR